MLGVWKKKSSKLTRGEYIAVYGFDENVVTSGCQSVSAIGSIDRTISCVQYHKAIQEALVLRY